MLSTTEAMVAPSPPSPFLMLASSVISRPSSEDVAASIAGKRASQRSRAAVKSAKVHSCCCCQGDAPRSWATTQSSARKFHSAAQTPPCLEPPVRTMTYGNG